MAALKIALTVISRTALSVGAGGSVGTLADKSIVRDGWNRPIIPGSQVKGKLRWAAEQLLRGLGKDIPSPFEGREREELPTLVRAIFGSPEQRSPLYFADLPGFIGAVTQITALRDSPEQQQSLIRPSVALNRHLGTAEEQRLLFQEVAPEPMQFHAERAIMGQLPDRHHAALLWAAIRLTTRWGGAKSRGMGWAEVQAQVWLDQTLLTDAELPQAVRELVQSLELR